MEFRPLKANEIDCRIQSLSGENSAVGAVVLLYKDARVDMRMLDEVVGPMNWQREHKIVGDRLYCTVSIYNEKTCEWVSKSDVGTESNTEKEKGQASDSFKRACFNWGIGRELYSAPFTYINLQKGEWYEGKDGKPKSYAKFRVKEISYDENRNISKLIIVDSKGAVRFTMGGNAQQQTQETVYNWKTLKARATQGGVTEDALKDYLKNELKVNNTDEMTRDHYQKAFDWVNSQRYKR